MKKHEIVHSDEKPFKCTFCEKYFRRKYDCTRHMKGNIVIYVLGLSNITTVVHVQKILKRKLETIPDESEINEENISPTSETSGTLPLENQSQDPPKKIKKTTKEQG